jgi:predicted NUDIX family NTP pyrophosphohydrolase
MKTKQSAGILAYRIEGDKVEVLLVHPGGPFFVKKDMGVWSIPKGEFGDDEEPLMAALREFAEELGQKPEGPFQQLKPVKQKSGKVVHAWATNEFLDVADFQSNTFSIEWPPRSGRQQSFPEVDRAEWFEVSVAKQKINIAQITLIEELVERLGKK